MTRVSVVIPAYNAAHLLPRAVRSVLEQTHPAQEIVVVDDGSIDDTAAVVRNLRGPIHYIYHANSGCAAARNLGVQASHGALVALLDADDEWSPTKLQCQVAALGTVTEARWCFTGCTVAGPSGPLEGPQGFVRAFHAFQYMGCDPQALFSEHLERFDLAVGDRSLSAYQGDLFALLFYGNIVLPSSVVMWRDAFDEVGGFSASLRVAEETEFFHRLAARFRAVLIDEPLTVYHTTGSGLTAPQNTPELVSNALLSLASASRLRPLTPKAKTALETSRRHLYERLAYSRLSLLDGSGARAAVREAQHVGVRTVRLMAIALASVLPKPLLLALHAAKRALRRG